MVANDQFQFEAYVLDSGPSLSFGGRTMQVDNFELFSPDDLIISIDGVHEFGADEYAHDHGDADVHGDQGVDTLEPIQGGFDAKGDSAPGASGSNGSGGVAGATGSAGATNGAGASGADGANAAGGAKGPNPAPTPSPTPTTGTLTFGAYTTSSSAFNITIEFKGAFTQALHDVFVDAAERIAKVVIGDLPDARTSINGSVVKVDDLYISAELTSIDGVGGVLGRAGPTAVRGGTYLPVTGTMQFDTADAESYQNKGLFDEIVTHEMLHTLGFGSLWTYTGLTNADGYVGGHALDAYNDLLGAAGRAAQGYVPLETSGGAGTAGSHWAEGTFDSELMTGYIDAVDPLSRMTAASLWDLGYKVNLNGPIDGYALG